MKGRTAVLLLANAHLLKSLPRRTGSVANDPDRVAPKNDAAPTMPLAREEVRAMFAAAGGGTREGALLMLMRYSGLPSGTPPHCAATPWTARV